MTGKLKINTSNNFSSLKVHSRSDRPGENRFDSFPIYIYMVLNGSLVSIMHNITFLCHVMLMRLDYKGQQWPTLGVQSSRLEVSACMGSYSYTQDLSNDIL